MKALGKSVASFPLEPVVERYSGAQPYTGSESGRRLDSLRSECLERDGHRCVITGTFDVKTAELRDREFPGNARDDDGRLFDDERDVFADVELAHIIPRSLTNNLDSVCSVLSR